MVLIKSLVVSIHLYFELLMSSKLLGWPFEGGGLSQRWLDAIEMAAVDHPDFGPFPTPGAPKTDSYI